MRDDREVEIMLCGVDGVSDWVHAVDDNGANVAGCYGRSYEENAANARLIAAAPTMLAALEAILAADNAPHSVALLDVARAAVAKATGAA
jgi:hypothetical protein